MDNNRHWDALHKPPAEMLKKIGGGRLKGMTDINPQWRLSAMTAHFGPIGKGWGYEIKRLWTEPGAGDEVAAFAHVELWYMDGENRCDSVGIGGSMLVEKEKNGLHTSDEAYKMALTDALSVAMKQIGLAAAIYMGQWDGSKYRADSKPSEPEPPITEEQAADLEALATEVSADMPAMLKHYGVKSVADLNAQQYRQAVGILEKRR